MRTISNAICGAVVGELCGAEELIIDEKPTGEHIDAREFFENDWIYQTQRYVTSSINSIKEINPKMIHNILATVDSKNYEPDDGSVLCWIFPLGFYASYPHNHGYMSEDVLSIVKTTHDTDEAISACIEYTRLIHDIFWNNIGPDDILKILPELDIPKEKMVTVARRHDVKSVFTSALWAFANSKSFNEVFTNAYLIRPSRTWVYCVAGTLAGLYYGIDEIADRYIFDTGAQPFIDDLMLN